MALYVTLETQNNRPNLVKFFDDSIHSTFVLDLNVFPWVQLLQNVSAGTITLRNQDVTYIIVAANVVQIASNTYSNPSVGTVWQDLINLVFQNRVVLSEEEIVALISGGTAGVASFNGRQGIVTLLHSDVTTALGYTPFAQPTGTNLQYITGAGNLQTFPTSLSSFTNDPGYITASSHDTLTNKQGLISMWTNDAGYLTASTFPGWQQGGNSFTALGVLGTIDNYALEIISASNSALLLDGTTFNATFWSGANGFVNINGTLYAKAGGSPAYGIITAADSAGRSALFGDSTMTTTGFAHPGLQINVFSSRAAIQAFSNVQSVIEMPLTLNETGGNVLIGTTTDSGFKLDVNGKLIIENVSGPQLFFQTQFGGSSYLTMGYESGYNYYIRTNNGGQGSINMDFSSLNGWSWVLDGSNNLIQTFTGVSVIAPALNKTLWFGDTGGSNTTQGGNTDTVLVSRTMDGQYYNYTTNPVLTVWNGSYVQAAGNVYGPQAYWYRNGYIGIGTSNAVPGATNTLRAALTINQGTKTGYRNTAQTTQSQVVTTGSSTLVSFTPDNGNAVPTFGLIVGSIITANSETRTIVAVNTDNVTVDSAVDWSAGYTFTYRNPYIDIADGATPFFSISPAGNVLIGTRTDAGVPLLIDNSLMLGDINNNTTLSADSLGDFYVAPVTSNLGVVIGQLEFIASGNNPTLNIHRVRSSGPMYLNFIDSTINVFSIEANDGVGFVSYTAESGLYQSWFNGASEVMRLSTGNNLLIRTTTDNTAALQVNGWLYSSSGLSIGSFTWSSGTPVNGLTISGIAPAVYYVGSGAGFSHSFRTNSSTSIGERLRITDSNVMLLNSHVLIGTTSDNGDVLQVAGDVTVTSSVTVGDSAHNGLFILSAVGKTPITLDSTNAPNDAIVMSNVLTMNIPIVSNTSGQFVDVYASSAMVSGLDMNTSGWTTVPIRPGQPLGNANNATGVDLILQGGQGTGTGPGGNIDFQVKVADGSGSQVLSVMGTVMQILQSSGHVLIGTTTDNGYLLQVNGPASFASSITTSGAIMDSTGIATNNIRRLTDTTMFFWPSGNTLVGMTFQYQSNISISATFNAYVYAQFIPVFNPTSGTASHATIEISPVITQTGGATGTTRGLYIVPSLTNAADWRAIEVVTGNSYLGTTSGNLIIGSTTDNGARAQIIQSLTGSANTTALSIASTYNTTGVVNALSMNVTNTASGTNSMLVNITQDSILRFGVFVGAGRTYFTSNGVQFETAGGTAGGISLNGSGPVGNSLVVSPGFAISNSSTPSGSGINILNFSTVTSVATSGTTNMLNTIPGFAPTSGTAVFNTMNIAPGINQTGGANGITRGIYIAPSLIAAADFRALEVSTGKSVFFGNVLIGSSTDNGDALQVTGKIYAATNTSDSSFVLGDMEIQSIGAGNDWITQNLYYNGTNFTYRSTGVAAMLRFLSGNVVIQTAVSGTAGTTATLTNSLEMFNSGNVSILGGGTDNGHALQVAGAGYFAGDSSSVGIYLVGGNAIRTTGAGNIYVDTLSGSGGSIFLRANGNYSVASFSSGRVAIGSSSDDGVNKLQVNGSINAASYINIASGGAGGNALLSSSAGSSLIITPLGTTGITLGQNVVRTRASITFNNPANFTSITDWYNASNTNVARMLGSGNFLLGFTTDDGINKLQVNGSAKAKGLTLGYTAVTTTYSISVTDYTVECTSGTFTVTLPTAVGVTGQLYNIKNSGTGSITLTTTSSQTIDGAATVTLLSLNSITVQSNGSNWIVL